MWKLKRARDAQKWREGKGAEAENEALVDYTNKMMNTELEADDMADPLNIQRKAHDKTIHELREGLTKAVGSRREEALPLAI